MNFALFHFQLNVFHLEAVDLLDIQKVIVGHDRSDIGDGCYLEKAVVRVWSSSGLRLYTFPCNRYDHVSPQPIRQFFCATIKTIFL